MPCIRNDNGRAVPGAKGSCPTGSSWSDTADNDKFDWQDVSTWAKRRYFDEEGDIRPITTAMDLGTAALVSNPVGLGIRGAMTAGARGIPWLMGKMFGKKVAARPAVTSTTQVPKLGTPFTAPNKKPHWAIGKDGKPYAVPFKPGSTFTKPTTKPITTVTKPAVPAGRAFSPLRTAAVTGAGAQAVDFFAPFTAVGKENKRIRDANAAALASKKVEDEQIVQDAASVEAAKVQAEKDRVANLGFWEKMKEPGYWDEVDGTGLTRLDRLGQLMTYYGQTPKQRADSISPADRWAEMTTANASTAASLQKSMLADSPFSNIGDKTGMASIKKLVKEEYGDKWYTFGEDEEGVDQITAAIYTRMVNLAKLNPGKSILEYYEEAKADYDASEEA